MRGQSVKHQKEEAKTRHEYLRKQQETYTERRADDDLEQDKKQEGEVKYRIYRADRISAIDSPDYLMFSSFHPHDLNI